MTSQFPAWQSIDSAEKNSIQVLLFEPEGYFVIQGYYWNGGWLTHDGGEPIFPSHWMPLPEAPA